LGNERRANDHRLWPNSHTNGFSDSFRRAATIRDAVNCK
jgi:hypothetical protein